MSLPVLLACHCPIMSHTVLQQPQVSLPLCGKRAMHSCSQQPASRWQEQWSAADCGMAKFEDPVMHEKVGQTLGPQAVEAAKKIKFLHFHVRRLLETRLADACAWLLVAWLAVKPARSDTV